MGIPDPELDAAASAMVRVGARFVVVGGFSVTANRFVRATEDIEFLVPDEAENDRRVLAALRNLDAARFHDEESLRDEHVRNQTHLRVMTRAGVIDILRGGLPPLDYRSVEERAIRADYGGMQFPIAGLSSIVAFMRLFDRPVDRNDLIGLAEIHGSLPIEPIPGIDT